MSEASDDWCYDGGEDDSSQYPWIDLEVEIPTFEALHRLGATDGVSAPSSLVFNAARLPASSPMESRRRVLWSSTPLRITGLRHIPASSPILLNNHPSPPADLVHAIQLALRRGSEEAPAPRRVPFPRPRLPIPRPRPQVAIPPPRFAIPPPSLPPRLNSVICAACSHSAFKPFVLRCCGRICCSPCIKASKNSKTCPTCFSKMCKHSVPVHADNMICTVCYSTMGADAVAFLCGHLFCYHCISPYCSLCGAKVNRDRILALDL